MSRRFESYRLLGPVDFKTPAQGRLFAEPADSTIGTPMKPSAGATGRVMSPIGIFGRDFSPSNFRSLNDQDRLEVRLKRGLLLNIFGVKNLSDIYEASKEPENRTAIYNRFIEGFGAMAGLDGIPFEEKEARIKQS